MTTAEGRMDAPVLRVLLGPSQAILTSMLALVVWAGYLTVTAPDDFRGPYVVLLLCQSFAASTGYATRARRGHFDQLLAGRRSRWLFGLRHAVTSIAVGAIAWLAVSVLEAIGTGGHWPSGLTPGPLAAFAYISAAAWACSAPFSRYSAGLVWLLVGITLAGSGRLVALRNVYVASFGTWTSLWQSAGAAVLFPPLVVGELSGPPAFVTVVLLIAAVGAVAGGIWFVAGTSLPLEDAE